MFLGGVPLIDIGVLGEKIVRIYVEAANRPRYVIKGNLKGGNRE